MSDKLNDRALTTKVRDMRYEEAGYAMRFLKAERDRLYKEGGELLAKDTQKDYLMAERLYARGEDVAKLIDAIRTLKELSSINQNGE